MKKTNLGIILIFVLIIMGCATTGERRMSSKEFEDLLLFEAGLYFISQGTYNNRIKPQIDFFPPELNDLVIYEIPSEARIPELRNLTTSNHVISFDVDNMPQDLEYYLREYKTDAGLTYYEYVCDYVDKIIVSPQLYVNGYDGERISPLSATSATYRDTLVYSGQRVVHFNNSAYADITYSLRLIYFLIGLIHETSHKELGYILETNNSLLHSYSRNNQTLFNERFALLREREFINVLLVYHKKNIRIRNYLTYYLKINTQRLTNINTTLGLDQNNFDLIP